MARKLIIFGNTEIARLAYEYFRFDSEYEVAGFTVDAEYIKDDRFENLPVIPFEDVSEHFPVNEFDAFVAVGSQKLNRLRRSKYESFKAQGYTLASYVSSQAFIWHNVGIGENCFILENNTLQPFVEIGHNVTLWSGNHIGHSSIIEDHCFIASQVVISGFCKIGKNSFLGVNSAIAEGVELGEDNFIGMSAIVNKSTVPDSMIAPRATEAANISARRFCRVSE